MIGLEGARLVRRLLRDSCGQSFVELALLMPVLLVIGMGLVEVGHLIDVAHEIRGIAREGANLASRGVPLDSVVSVSMMNGQYLDLDQKGGIVVSAVRVRNRAPVVQDQTASRGFEDASVLGGPGDVAKPLGSTLLDDQSVSVLEVFYNFEPVTPLSNLFYAVFPEQLYERAIF